MRLQISTFLMFGCMVRICKLQIAAGKGRLIMKKIKMLIPCVVALLMVLSLSTISFAAEQPVAVWQHTEREVIEITPDGDVIEAEITIVKYEDQNTRATPRARYGVNGTVYSNGTKVGTTIGWATTAYYSQYGQYLATGSGVDTINSFSGWQSYNNRITIQHSGTQVTFQNYFQSASTVVGWTRYYSIGSDGSLRQK